MKRLVIVGALLGLAATVQAAEYKAGAISVVDPWARASAGMARTGAAYARLVNTGDTEDRLISAASPVAEKVEIHTHIQEGNVLRMREVEAIPLPPGTTVTLEPGGYHLMLMGLERRLEKGERVPGTLVFERAGTVAVEFQVEGVAAHSPGHTMTDHSKGH